MLPSKSSTLALCLEIRQSAHVNNRAFRRSRAIGERLEMGAGVFCGNDLDVGRNVVLGAKVEHFLRLVNATHQTSLDRVFVEQEHHGRKGCGLRDSTDANVGATDLHGGKQFRAFVRDCNGVDNHVKGVRGSLERLLVGMRQNIGTQSRGLLLFGSGSRQDGHFGAHGFGELDTHHAQSTKADNADSLASATALLENVLVQWRKHCDPCAQEWSHVFQVRVRGCLEDKVFAHGNLAGVTAVGVVTGALVVALALGVGRAVRLHDGAAVVLFAAAALFAGKARVHKAADADLVADFELGHFGTNFLDFASDSANKRRTEVQKKKRNG